MSWKAKANLKQILKEEEGTVIKDWGGKTAVALLYPNTYFVGMSNLGVHNVYRLLNEREDVVCERVFLPARHSRPRLNHSGVIPAFAGTSGNPLNARDPRFLGDAGILSVESQRPLADFDIIAVSIAYENDIENLKYILEASKLSAGTGRPHIVAGGAAVTLNPQLFRGLVDEVAVGDFERACHREESRHMAGRRGDLVHSLEFGGLLRFARNDVQLAHNVIWTPNTEFGSMHLVEMQRGCPHKCRFCAAPVIYHPFRQFSKEDIIAAIDIGLPHRRKIGLIGGDVLAHPDFIEIAEYIHSKGAAFSPSSVRADRVTSEVARLLRHSGHKTITLAPEAGREALRKGLGKNISDDEFFHAAEMLVREGIRQFKLYFMMGLPGETDDDIEAIVKLVERVRGQGSRDKGQGGDVKITVAVNPFVPKRGTEFEKEKFIGVKILKERSNRLKKLLGKVGGVQVKVESPFSALYEYELQK